MCLLKKEKICAIIVAYNPNHLLLELVDTIKVQVDKIIVIDNNSNTEHFIIVQKLIKCNDVILIRNDDNFGIGRALNQGVKVAINLKYDWAVTFDQDTVPNNDIIEIISEVFNEFEEKKNIGAIGVNYILKNSQYNYFFNNEKNYFIKDVLITSGCLISLECFLLIGGFREDFFIDHVDEEYSLRLKSIGKLSLITNMPGMVHECGKQIGRKFCGITFTSTNHSKLRRYYMARNQIILSKEFFFKFPSFTIKSNLLFLYEIFQMLLLDNSKIEKIMSTLKGVWDGIFYSSKNSRYYDFE